MNAAGTLPAANDDGAEIAALRQEMQAHTRVTMAGYRMLADGLRGIRASNGAMHDLAEQQFARA